MLGVTCSAALTCPQPGCSVLTSGNPTFGFQNPGCADFGSLFGPGEFPVMRIRIPCYRVLNSLLFFGSWNTGEVSKRRYYSHLPSDRRENRPEFGLEKCQKQGIQAKNREFSREQGSQQT